MHKSQLILKFPLGVKPMWQNEEAEVEEEWAEAGSSIKKREMAMAEEEGEVR